MFHLVATFGQAQETLAQRIVEKVNPCPAPNIRRMRRCLFRITPQPCYSVIGIGFLDDCVFKGYAVLADFGGYGCMGCTGDDVPLDEEQ